ncbi:MAG: FecR domain-containing protein [Pseudomonadaceae bacterium]|nr:FecR domain-containing protein [Pseudomonadaceae bacterium]
MLARRAVAGISLILLLLSPRPAIAEDWVYTIRPGDELWSLAAKYCGSANYADELATHNSIADAADIRPGSRLRIPVDWLVRAPAHAVVVDVQGDVVLVADQGDMSVAIGSEVQMGMIIRTSSGSAAVRFADGSILRVAPESEVLFNVLTVFGDTGMVDTHLRYLRGRGESQVVRQRTGSRFRVATPSGVAAVRGTNFRVSVGADKTLSETVTGSIDFVQPAQTSEVPAGFGVVASAAGVVKETLLAAPSVTAPRGMLPPESQFQWQALAEASGYRVKLFRPDRLDVPDTQVIVSSAVYQFAPEAQGDYLLSVRAIADSGLEGFEARQSVSIGRVGPVPELQRSARKRVLSWSPSQPPYDVQVTDSTGARRELTVAENELSVETFAPGRYSMQVRAADTAFGMPAEFSVQPDAVSEVDVLVAAEEKSATVSWTAPANAEQVRVSVLDSRGRTLISELTSEASFSIPVKPGRQYEVQLVSIANGITSQPAIEKFSGPPVSRWWLLSMLAPLLAL